MTCVWCDDLEECIFNWKCPKSNEKTKKFVRDTFKKCWWNLSETLVIIDKAWINPCINCIRQIIEK